MKIWIVLLCTLFTWSCGQTLKKKQASINEYYDINGLIDRQENLLATISPNLLKNASINGQEDITELVAQDSLWQKELQIFRTADINEPMLIDRYSELEEQKGDISTASYISKSRKQTDVDTLRITFDDRGHVQQVFAFMESENTLFKTRKELLIHFSDYDDYQLIDEYSIRGWQKMISKDSVHFSIEGKILPR